MSIKINVYLNFKGTCKDAFTFYSKVFSTPIAYSWTYGEQEEMSFIKEEDKQKILHCALPIAKETLLLGADIVEGCGDLNVVEGTNVTMSIDPGSEDEARRIFDELSEGGTIIMPLEKTFWNALYGMFTDKFGIHWMVNYSYEEHS